MFSVTVIWLGLAHGMASDTFNAASAHGTTKFPTEEACKAAGEIIYSAHAAQIDAALKAAGIGVLQGARIDCKRDGEQI